MAVAQDEIAVEWHDGDRLRQVGMRDLKATTSEVIRYVRERQAPVEITHRGQVVAKIVPVPSPAQLEEERAAREARWQRLSEEATRLWPEGVSAVDAIRDVRDDGW